MKIGTDPKRRKYGARRVSGVAGALVVLVAVMIGSLGSASAGIGDTDLALTKSDSPDPVVKNGTLTYTIQVQNLGVGAADDATAPKVIDTLPGNVSFISATPTTGSCSQAGGVVTCNLADLLIGTSATVTIVVKPTKTGTLSNTASVSTASGDTNAANNTDTEATQVNDAAKAAKGKGKGKGKGKKKAKVSCKKPTIVGTIGNDVLFGTPAGDVIATFSGNDRVFAGGGNDIVCAGLGRDRVNGGPGADSLSGSGGRDRLKGKAGNDILDGGRSRDRCRGGPGRDTLVRCP